MSKIVVTSAYPELTSLIKETALQLKIDVTIVEAVLEDAVEQVLSLTKQNKVQVIVSRGATAELLKQTFPLPVISLAPSEADVLLALALAKNCSSRIGYFSYPSLTNNEFLAKVRAILQININHYPFRNINELSTQMEQAHHDGCVITVGGGHQGLLLSNAFGMESLLIYSSLSTVAGALERAAEIVASRQKKREEEERQRRVSMAKGLVTHFKFSDLVGPTLKDTIEKAKRFSKADGTVLIWGESGTGKELFAQSIHNDSLRSNGPFVAINCAALPDNLLESELFGYEDGAFTGAKKGGKIGLFELASGGTLFLDEIGKMSRDLQARLLRVIQTREVRKIGGERIIPVKVRIITASNEDLQAAVAQGNFRADLFYRLNVLNLHLLPLRKRRADIPVLIENYLERYDLKNGLKPILKNDFMVALNNYDWPGNIRELENILERYAVLIGSTEPPNLEEVFASFPEFWSRLNIELDGYLELDGERESTQTAFEEETVLEVKPGTLENMEIQLITLLLKRYQGNRTLLAEKLQISRTTLWKKLRFHEVVE